MSSNRLVNTLEVSSRDRAISRICFYLLVTFVMWSTNHLVADWEYYDRAEASSEAVARPLIAVPVSKLSFVPVER